MSKHSIAMLRLSCMILLFSGCADHQAKQSGIATRNPEADTPIPVIALQAEDRLINRQALGRVDYDLRYARIIPAQVSGRIEKLYVKYRYQHIHQGARIMDIYSPELVTAQQDLLFLLRNDPGNTTLQHAAREKLLLLGMTGQQLDQVIHAGKVAYTVPVYSAYSGHIHDAGAMNDGPQHLDVPEGSAELPIKEGMYVTKGQPVFQLFNTDNSWVILNIFAGDLPFVKAGTPVRITAETAPEQPFDARINFVEPFFRSDDKTLRARVYFNNATRQIPVGSQVKALIYSRSGLAWWLPRKSVLSLGLHNVVLRKEEAGFKIHPIQIGIMTDSVVQVISGLNMQDRVAADAQFLIDNEHFIKTKQPL